MAFVDLPTVEAALGSVVNNVDQIDASHLNELRRLIESLSARPTRRFPNDGSANYVEIDQATGRLNFSGTFRPTVEIPVPFRVDVSGTGGSGFSGGINNVNAFYAAPLADAAQHGIQTYPIELPPWVDVSDTIDVIVWWQWHIAQLNNSVVMDTYVDYAVHGGNTVSEVASTGNLITCGSISQATSKEQVGSFAGGTFPAGCALSMTVRRDGTHVNDNYTTTPRMSRIVALRCRRLFV